MNKPTLIVGHALQRRRHRFHSFPFATATDSQKARIASGSDGQIWQKAHA
jgi:uncharacterized protein with von Willebrand factor type A (vWA) domain